MKLLARASAGLIVWAAGFSLLYALHGLGCASGWKSMWPGKANLFIWVLGTVWFLALGAGIGTIWWTWKTLVGFERHLAVASAGAGFAGTFITGAPIALVSACL
ncbi:hypothetical protein [Sphingobium olei]|uniref:Uncharacterized protein n=1 Tax=Sphingobium olei TaxID=420955 RepID=A0ABW3NWH7_9SPHN